MSPQGTPGDQRAAERWARLVPLPLPPRDSWAGAAMRGGKEVFGRATPPRGKQTPGNGVGLKPKEERTDTGVGSPEALRAAPAACEPAASGLSRRGEERPGRQRLSGSPTPVAQRKRGPGAGRPPTRRPRAPRRGAAGPGASEGAACGAGPGRDWKGREGKDGKGRDGLLPSPCPRHRQPGAMRRPQRDARCACPPPTNPAGSPPPGWARPGSSRLPAGTDAPRACPSSAKATRAEGARSRRGGRSQVGD